MPARDPDKQLAKDIRQILLDKKALDVALLDIRNISSIASYFVICSGTSTRHVEAMGDDVLATLKKQGHIARGVEGKGVGDWVLLDYDSVIVHLFYHETRAFYQLEKLWHEAKVVK